MIGRQGCGECGIGYRAHCTHPSVPITFTIYDKQRAMSARASCTQCFENPIAQCAQIHHRPEIGGEPSDQTEEIDGDRNSSRVSLNASCSHGVDVRLVADV